MNHFIKPEKDTRLKRKFITNLLLLLFLNVLIKPFWIFGIDLTVQNLVGDENYGLYFSLLNFSMILNILLDIGITNYNNKNIAQNRQLLQKHVSNIVGLKFILAGVYAVVCLVTALIIGYRDVQIHLLLFLILNQFLISFTLYLRSNISGLHLFKTDSLLSVLDRTIMIIICSLLLFTNIVGHQFRIEWFVYAQSAAYFITALVTFGVVLVRTGKLKFYFDRRFFLVFLKKSYPYALLVLLMSFYNRIDSVMLERLLPNGKEQAGIYAHAFRLLDAVSMFGVLFAGLLLPIFARMIKQKEDIGSMVQFSFLLLFVPAVIISLSAGFYDHEIMVLLNYSNTELSASILRLLMVSFLGIATTYIFGTLLTANGSIRQLNQMAVAGMILNIGINLLLIPKMQAMGSAWASLVTQLFTALAQTLLAVRFLKLNVNYPLIGKLMVFIGFVFLAGYLTKQLDNWVAGFFIMILASALFAFFSRLINLTALSSIIRNDPRV
ncbi:MAG: oligosaccharide flippase family protein [Prolixibacteraceae bacterium]|nr:oligosaccharide flippase family protein [Prolixibacteraceae bacterium]